MFERFTHGCIKAIMLAQEEGRIIGHNYVDTEQLLLGLIGEGTGIAARSLKATGVSLKEARISVEAMIGRGNDPVDQVECRFKPKVKRILELSWDEARKLNHNFVGTEHLLLGLIREANESLTGESQGVAFRVLRNLNVDLDVLRTEVFDAIKK